MLPSSKSSLISSGMSSAGAAYAMIGCFLGGVIGIQFLSYIIHRFIPSHVVDCDHAHKDEGGEDQRHISHTDSALDIENQNYSDERPLLSRDDDDLSQPVKPKQQPTTQVREWPDAPRSGFQSTRRPSLQALRSFVSNAKARCGEGGPCFGYSNPCGNECFKVISQPGNSASKHSLSRGINAHAVQRTVSHPAPHSKVGSLEELNEEFPSDPQEGDNPNYGSFSQSNGNSWKQVSYESDNESYSTFDDNHNDGHRHTKYSEHSANHHHHHVPSNAFLSIGLQTSIAIALHKLPEGFITFATNHANPKLGFSVFMALFIHNITEGFALALPLYLAINSRLKAMIWASVLGGASQPLGAAIAVVWFKVAKSRDMVPSESVYGVMFAITSGIMTSVALQLFSESLTLTHRKGICITFAFIGMGILGLSNALTA